MKRRQVLEGGLGLLVSGGGSLVHAGAQVRTEGLTSPSGAAWNHLVWAKGIEGQRKADTGHGSFLNPVFSGDHPDPAIIKVGDTFYVTFSSFDSYPGLMIWRSQDLVNWTPVIAALTSNIGSVWAPALAYHGGRFYLYIPARTPSYRSIYVVHADQIEGPWSAPIDLKLSAHIDPEHVADTDGSRWLFLSGGDRIALSADGLSTLGSVEHVYDPWRYPPDWTVEGFSPEGPKIFRRGTFWYIITAVGGTAGPPTGHMVIIARATDLKGPWINCPQNPIVRTWSATEKWWSRGHASMIEAPNGTWWMVYHGYENGFWTLGRQMLMEPMDWTRDGWPVAKGGDLSRPIRKPIVSAGEVHGQKLSDDFRTNRLGNLWSFYDPGPNEAERFVIEGGQLHLAPKGQSPTNGSPLTLIAGDLTYEIEVCIDIKAGDEAGLLLFYSKRLYVGLGFDETGLIMHRYGRQRRSRAPFVGAKRLHIRLRNDANIVTLHHSQDGVTWQKFPVQMEVSGYHHNTDGDFLSLRPALYACGSQPATFSNFSYRA
jgi:xylan 1,4-beta-xylosidase